MSELSNLSQLPPLERMQRYIDLAEDARREAERSSGVARSAYLTMAEQWERLATEVARQQVGEKSGARH